MNLKVRVNKLLLTILKLTPTMKRIATIEGYGPIMEKSIKQKDILMMMEMFTNFTDGLTEMAEDIRQIVGQTKIKMRSKSISGKTEMVVFTKFID